MKIQPKGNSYDGSNEYKEKQNHVLLIIGIISLLAIIISTIIFLVSRSKKCTNIENTILTRAEEYVKEKKLLPTIEGESITINIKDLFTEHSIPTIKENACDGTITFTNYKNEYIKSFDITNCSYCSTSKRYKNWSEESETFPKNEKNVQVITYYNYYEVSVYNSQWSDWLPSNEITETNKKFNITLPESQKLPSIPGEGVILKYEKEEQTYYSYRDKLYRFYKDNGGTYSEYSSEQPAGFSKYDSSTEIETDWTEWSLNYPEKKSYRTITSTSGYRWYYEENNQKHYWNSGNYTPDQPSEKYNKKEKESVTMYRYKDKLWRWYNGEKRNYSSFKAEPYGNYTIKDTGYSKYTDWSYFKPTSSLTNENQAYREERTDTYSRYRIIYQMKTFLQLDKYLSKNEFEKQMHNIIPELMKNENILIDIKYKFKYRK